MYSALISQLIKTLGQFDAWFTAAEDYAAARGFEPSVLLAARLSPDQFPMVRQIQASCDTVKLGAARLANVEAPVHADDETDFAALRTRVAEVIAFVKGLPDNAFAEAATRSITQPRWKGQSMTGHDYLLEHVLPNFYFHSTHVYALLRHNGVPVGKKHFLGELSKH